MATIKKPKKSKTKINNKDDSFKQIQPDRLLNLIKFTYFQNESILSLIIKISKQDLENIIDILYDQIYCKELYITAEQFNLNLNLYQLLNIYYNDKIQENCTKSKKKDTKITFSLHALKQMELPKRKITKNKVEEIIKNKEYILTDNNKRRIYIDRNSDPNNWIKIITSNKSNPHVITAIRNDPVDEYFTFSSLKFLKDNNINKEEILDIIKYGHAEEFENDKLIIKQNKFSILTSKNKKKILSIRYQ